MKEPKKAPVTIPSQNQLDNITKKRRLKKLMEKQGILYGINVLDTTMPDEKVEAGALKLRQAQRKSAIEVLKESEDLFQTYICQQEGAEDITQSTKQSSNMFDKLVIEKDSSWKNAFDMLMLFASCYNVFT